MDRIEGNSEWWKKAGGKDKRKERDGKGKRKGKRGREGRERGQ